MCRRGPRSRTRVPEDVKWLFFSLWINTMNRWHRPSRAVFLFLAMLLAAVLAWTWPTGPAQAQVKRSFPFKSEPARVEFTASARDIVVNGRPERTGPGLRVFDTRNRLVFANRLQGQRFEVQLRRGPGRVVQEIWILNPAELADPRRARSTHRRTNLVHEFDPGHYMN